MSGTGSTRVLHVNDAASTAAVLLGEAHRRGLPWRHLPLAKVDPRWRGPWRTVRRAVRGAAWEARLAALAASADLVHVHVASVTRHTGWVPLPTVLHLHGTDIRSHQYDAALGPLIRRAVERADAVVYSTPDLAHHVAWRDGARLVPVPIDTDRLPPWAPHPTPRVVFASRWQEVKGLPVQLSLVRRLRERRPDVELVGLDWGEGAGAARQAEVRLVARLPHAQWLTLLASAHVVVGQPTGMVAASELEAIGIGVPTVAPLRRAWYEAAGAPVPPVVGGLGVGDAFRLPPQDAASAGEPPLAPPEVEAVAATLADGVVAALEDPARISGELGGVLWLPREHGAGPSVDRVIAVYDHVMAGRRR